MFIAIVGTKSSGKSTVLEYLVQQKGFSPIYLSSSSSVSWACYLLDFADNLTPSTPLEKCTAAITGGQLVLGQSSDQDGSGATNVLSGHELSYFAILS